MSIYYKQHGDPAAPLLLFLHGGGVSGWMWDKQVDYFSRHYHCIVPDLPGHGVSYQDSSFSMQATSEQLIALIEKMSCNKTVTVVGFSLGAQLLVHMLSSAPDLIDYAMINSALVMPVPLTVPLIAPLITLSYPLIKLRAFARLQARTLYIGDDDFEQYYKESCQMKRNILIEVLQQNMSFHLPDGFADARANLLITVGKRERAIMKKSAAQLHQHHANSKLIIFNDAGHGVSLQNPALFNETIAHWLNNKLQA